MVSIVRSLSPNHSEFLLGSTHIEGQSIFTHVQLILKHVEATFTHVKLIFTHVQTFLHSGGFRYAFHFLYMFK